MILFSFSIIHWHIPSEFPDYEDYVIVDFTSAKFNKDCLQKRNVKIDVRMIILSVKYIFLALSKRGIGMEYYVR